MPSSNLEKYYARMLLKKVAAVKCAALSLRKVRIKRAEMGEPGEFLPPPSKLPPRNTTPTPPPQKPGGWGDFFKGFLDLFSNQFQESNKKQQLQRKLEELRKEREMRRKAQEEEYENKPFLIPPPKSKYPDLKLI